MWEWYLIRTMVFLVRDRGAENIKKIGKKTEEKH